MFLSSMLNDVQYRGDSWVGHLKAKLVANGQSTAAVDNPQAFLLNRDSFRADFIKSCFLFHQSRGSVDSSPDTFFLFFSQKFWEG